MKKIYHLLLTLALVSCIKETDQERSITISLGQTDVKTALSSDREKMVWENEDRIGIYHNGEGIQNKVLEYAGSNEMSLSVPYSADRIYALYPYSGSAGENPQALTVVIPAQQTQDTPGTLAGVKWPMSAAAGIENEQARLTFTPLTALWALNIYSTKAENDEAVTKVRVTPTVNTRFCGNAVIDITSGSATFTSGNSSDPMTLSITNTRPLTSTKPADARLFEDQLYLCLARQSYKNVKFEIFTTAGKRYTLISNDNVINSVDNDITALNINLSAGTITIITTNQTEGLEEVNGTLSALEEVVRDPVIDDITEDMIPDFSRVGYHYGDDEIPHYDNVIATLYPTGDDTDRADEIQAALDAADGSTNSVVLLKKGDYYVSKSINIQKSHLVLRGEGGDIEDIGTRLIATGDSTMYQCVRLGESNKGTFIDSSNPVEISEAYVPVGRLSFRVYDASSFSIGDRILIYRPGTQQWIHDIRMDDISDGEHWTPDRFHLSQERLITDIVGNKIMIDAPIVMALDQDYGGGYVMKIHRNRIVESGVEDIFIESVYDRTVVKRYSNHTDLYTLGLAPVDENHCANAVKVVHCEHCWAKSVSGRYFSSNLVGMGTDSKNVTVLDCHSYYPVSLIQGSRRYAFSANGRSTMGLFKGCTAEYDRHQFVTTSWSTGPLVFTDCSATKCINETGPHCYWAVGVLYDCIRQDSSRLSVQDSDYIGTGASHGWQGANHVLWNCEAPKIICQSPWTAEGRHPTGRNYCIGCIGKKVLSTTQHSVTKDDLNDRPQGEWIPDPGEGNSNTEHVTSGTYFGVTANGLSLYEALLAQRKAAGIRAIPAEWYK